MKADLFALFGEKNPWQRGKQLESVLNRLFALDGLSIREAFHLNGDESEGHESSAPPPRGFPVRERKEDRALMCIALHKRGKPG